MNVITKFYELFEEIKTLELDEKITALNLIKEMGNEISPFRDEPVDCVLWVKSEEVEANDYNPNAVAPPEMKLLEHSIMSDGYTQPIVTWTKEGKREVIDGFHRTRVVKESANIRERLHDYAPVVTIKEDREGRNDRIASTIRHNRARGKHKVDSMSDIVVELKRRNWSPKKIGKELGMDQDEVLRLVQVSGLTEMFSDKEFSEAWKAEYLTEADFDGDQEAIN